MRTFFVVLILASFAFGAESHGCTEPRFGVNPLESGSDTVTPLSRILLHLALPFRSAYK